MKIKILEQNIILGALLGFSCGLLVLFCGYYISSVPDYSNNFFLRSIYWICIYLASVAAVIVKAILGTFLSEKYAILLNLIFLVYFSILGICFSALLRGQKKNIISFFIILIFIHGLSLYLF